MAFFWLTDLNALFGSRMRSALVVSTLLLYAGAVSATSPSPIVVDCPYQPAAQRMATKFIWDGASFKQVREDGRTFVRQVSAARESRANVEQGPRHDFSFQLVPSPEGVGVGRQDYVALELVGDEGKKGAVSAFFKMATLESGFLTESMLQHSQGCSVSGP